MTKFDVTVFDVTVFDVNSSIRLLFRNSYVGKTPKIDIIMSHFKKSKPQFFAAREQKSLATPGIHYAVTQVIPFTNFRALN